MGKGQRYVCCCDSKTWCCVIHWFQWIAGILFMSHASTYFFQYEKELKEYEKNYVMNHLDKHKKEKASPEEYKIFYLAAVLTNLISGLGLFGLGTILFCGVQRRSNKMLKAYIGCYIAFQVLDTITTVLLYLFRSDPDGDIFIHTPGFVRMLLIWFVVWVVNVHRREICNLGFEAFPISAHNSNYAVPQSNSKTGVSQSPSAIRNAALQTSPATAPAPVSTDDPAS